MISITGTGKIVVISKGLKDKIKQFYGVDMDTCVVLESAKDDVLQLVKRIEVKNESKRSSSSVRLQGI